MKEAIITWTQFTEGLPPSRQETLEPAIRTAMTARADAVIVLDDDPTGTQTVHDIPVLTTWREEDLLTELERGTPLFYVLTNSRSLSAADAVAVAHEIGTNIRRVAAALGKRCLIISRSDSTLRGHYPQEVDALETALGIDNSVRFIIPAFFEGGRFTVHDVHYVREGDRLIPAAQTPFAEDPVFGYRHSNLREWIFEKTAGAVSPEQVFSIELPELREGKVAQLRARLDGLPAASVCIVNAADYQDLRFFTLALLQSSVRPLFRTAASFVAALAAQEPRPLLTPAELTGQAGGLIVVGSYVPKTTQQLAHLMDHTDVAPIEVDVENLLLGNLPSPTELGDEVARTMSRGRDVLVFTSRRPVRAGSDKANLAIGRRVSAYLCDLVGALQTPPRYLLAKGGITSSDIATKSLGVRRATILGQIIAGVPVWGLGAESKFPGLAYIVFPGNVGDTGAVTEVVRRLGQD